MYDAENKENVRQPPKKMSRFSYVTEDALGVVPVNTQRNNKWVVIRESL